MTTQDDIAEVRDTLRANGVNRYGRYERENTYGALDALKRLEEQFETLQSAAIRLCNVHRWSYGGPETLIALADRIAESNPMRGET